MRRRDWTLRLLLCKAHVKCICTYCGVLDLTISRIFNASCTLIMGPWG
jgi:hypothetical protein